MMGRTSAQSMIEMLINYSWALLLASILIVVIFVLSGSPSGQHQLSTSCTIQPLFPCIDSTFGAVSQGVVPYYLTFTNNLDTPVYFTAANSFNLTTTGIGVGGKSITLGTCTPRFSPPGTKIICNANVIGSIEPAVGTNVNILFAFTYELCTANSLASCASSLYRTTGYATV